MEINDLKNVGVQLCIKYVLPYLKKIAGSLISKISKNLYEKLYSRFTKALESFETALKKCKETDDVQKLKKRLICVELGYKFFEKIQTVLNKVLGTYKEELEQIKNKYIELGGNIEDIEGACNG